MRTMLANTHRWWQLPTGLAGAVHRLPAGLQDKVSTAADMLWTQELNRCDLLLAHFGGNGLQAGASEKAQPARAAHRHDLPRQRCRHSRA